VKLYTEGLHSFTPWSGAVDTWNRLTGADVGRLESILDDLYPEGMNVTELNDLLWFEPGQIADWLGFDYCADNCGFEREQCEHCGECTCQCVRCGYCGICCEGCIICDDCELCATQCISCKGCQKCDCACECEEDGVYNKWGFNYCPQCDKPLDIELDGSEELDKEYFSKCPFCEEEM